MGKGFDKILKTLNLNDDTDEEYYDAYESEEDYEDIDDSEEYVDEIEEKPVKKKEKKTRSVFNKKKDKPAKQPVKRHYMDDDDEYDDGLDDYVEPEVERPRKTAAASTHRSIPGRNNNIVALHSQARGSMDIYSARPQDFNSVEYITDLILTGTSVLINFEQLSDAEAQRIVDFVSGTCHAIGGEVKLLADRIVIAAPNTVGLNGEYPGLDGASMSVPSFNSIEEE